MTDHSVTVDEMASRQQCVYASCGGRVKLKFSFYISFRHVGQDAASNAAAVINLAVGNNWVGFVDRDVLNRKIRMTKN